MDTLESLAYYSTETYQERIERVFRDIAKRQNERTRELNCNWKFADIDEQTLED